MERNIVNDKYNFAYLTIPKAANSSVKYALLPTISKSQNDTIHDSPIIQNLHRTDKDLYVYSDKQSVLHKDYSLVFAVVRNSWTRIASCYIDKIQHAFHKPFAEYGMSPDTSFSEFVETIAQIPDDRSEIHFRSQLSFLFLGDIYLPNLTLKVESLNAQWPIIQSYFHSKYDLRIEDMKQICKRGNGKYADMYDRRTSKLIEQRYSDEIAFFNFSPLS